MYLDFINECRNKSPKNYQYHHIIPKCIGGTDDKDNLIKLSYEDHYRAHELLAMEYPDNEKIVKAFNLLGSFEAWITRCKNNAGKHPNRAAYGHKGKKHTEETKIKMSKNHANVSGSNNPNYGVHNHWYNNGIKSIRAFECPEGFVPGRL